MLINVKVMLVENGALISFIDVTYSNYNIKDYEKMKQKKKYKQSSRKKYRNYRKSFQTVGNYIFYIYSCNRFLFHPLQELNHFSDVNDDHEFT